MDTSEQYIKMWEQQGIRLDFNLGDAVYCPTAKGVFIYDGTQALHKDDFVLPRQDQLQEMLSFEVGTFNDNFWSALDDLHQFAFGVGNFINFIPETMEQLWLAFVMKERWNKTWNGETWI